MKSTLPFYQINSFADQSFTGNPACVCLIQGSWLPDTLLQKIARENNVSETAFVLVDRPPYPLRWFTPSVEVELCGHATLAAGRALLDSMCSRQETIDFLSVTRGKLSVKKNQDNIDLLELDFPLDIPQKLSEPYFELSKILNTFKQEPIEILQTTDDILVVFSCEQDVWNLTPNLELIKQLNSRGIIVTAACKSDPNTDFVSRFFAPRSGVAEDPVTGSTHTALLPYWSQVLGKNKLKAKQLSKRGGSLACFLEGNRAFITGSAKIYVKGELMIDL